MNRPLLWGLCALAGIVSQSSCMLLKKGRSNVSIKKETAAVAVIPADTSKTDTIAAVADTKRMLMDALVPVWKHEPDFTTFNGKAKMHYEGRGQKNEFTTIFRIRKDQVIWASVTALGGIVQVARIYITPDSLKLINYLEKEVTIMPLAEASKVLPAPADFSTLQSLVIGGVLRKTGNATDAVDMGNMLLLQVEETEIVQQINYSKADTTLNTLQIRSNLAGAPSGTVSFSDYQIVNGRRFANNRDINVLNAGEQYHLDINFNKAEFDQPTDFPFSIPKNYKRK